MKKRADKQGGSELPGTEEIKTTFNLWSTEYLISFWLANDREEYRDETFQVLKEILEKRGAILSNPGQPVSYQGKEYRPLKSRTSPAGLWDLTLRPKDIGGPLVTVDICYDLVAADLLKSRLEAEGIKAFLFGEHLIHLNWLYSRAIGGIKVAVREGDADRARRIVGLLNNFRLAVKTGEEAVRCPRCGSSEVSLKRTTWKIAFLAFFFLAVPLPFRKNIARCESCGHKWRTREKIPDNPRSKTISAAEEWVCSECGAEVTADAKICPKCGADVTEVEEESGAAAG